MIDDDRLPTSTRLPESVSASRANVALLASASASNPFAQTAGYRGEIWALGLRNPWGFAFEKQTGDLYIGNVGEGRFEEVNYQPVSSKGGENYGRHITEGIHCYRPGPSNARGLTRPVAEYPHSLGCAVVGGLVYRGSQSVQMQGIYFYAGFCSGRIWGLRRIGDNWQSALLYDAPFQITAIGEDEKGNPYVTNYIDGTILALEQRLQFSTPTPTGTAVATVTPTEQLADSTDTLAKEGTILFVEGGVSPVTWFRRSRRLSERRGRRWTASAIPRSGR